MLTTVAGSAQSGASIGVDGPVASATFQSIAAISIDRAGNVYIADNYRVRRYSPSLGTVTTVLELSDAPVALATQPDGMLICYRAQRDFQTQALKQATAGLVRLWSRAIFSALP